MTLYYQGDVKSSHEKVPYSNTSFRVTSIEESIKIKDFEGEFFLMTREKKPMNGSFYYLWNDSIKHFTLIMPLIFLKTLKIAIRIRLFQVQTYIIIECI